MGSRRAALALAAMILVAGAARWATRSRSFDHLDVVFFVRGVVDYTVEGTRPHFPGYPVFIWAGKAARWLFREPLEAVHAVAVAASTLIAVPLALFTAALRREQGASPEVARRDALASAAIWLVVPGSWINGGEAFSDSLGLLFASLALWCTWRAWDEGSGWAILAGLLGGLTVGARLVCVSLLAPLALLVVRDLRAGRSLRTRLSALLGLLAGVVPWLAWQFWMDGWALVRAGRGHVSGHFRGWGQSAFTDVQVWTRPLRMLRTLVVYGLGGGAPEGASVRLVVTALIVSLVLAGAVRLLRHRGHARTLFALWTLGYAAFVTVAHDVGFPRYSLPLAAAACVAAALGLPRGWPGTLLTASLTGLVLSVTLPLALEHRRFPPTELQLAEYLRGVPRPAALVSSQVSLPMVYAFADEMAPGVALAAAEPETLASVAASFESRGHTVYSTIPDAARPEEWVAVARFCRNPIFDPDSAPEIWVFRHEPGASPRPLPECHPRP